MDIKSVELFQQKAEQKFNELNQYKMQVMSRLKTWGLNSLQELEEEMNRLDGEFRGYDIIKQQLNSTPPVPAPPVDPQPTAAKTEVKKATK